ncbi:hypothetical protein JCM30237_24250 [Halolamina litorea]|uniref:Amidohydrolase family protein n=1 Tax=Halolamina litorea TaxID=1515593 RepID=A0ABD6BUT7_9EURY|nr:hypothetical protein [Halolamina litorea]
MGGIDREGKSIRPGLDLDVLFYGTELLVDRTVLAVGGDGTIVEGRPGA